MDDRNDRDRPAPREPVRVTARLAYGLDDVPRPPWKALGLGLQHVLTMFGATVAVPLLLGPAMGMGAEEIALLVSSVMIASGVATFLQVRIGTGLPIIQGVSFAFLGPFLAIIAATGSGAVSMQYIAGAILVGAVVEMAVGYGGLLGRLRRFVSPVVIGPVIILIGLSLFEVGAPQAGRNWLLSGLVVAGTFLFALVLGRRSRLFLHFPVLLALAAAYALAVALTLAGILEPGTPGHVSFAGVAAAPWLRNPLDLLLPWGVPRFSLGFILATLAAYLASMIESFGDYHAIARAAGAPDPGRRQIDRGIGAEGLGCFVSGLVGGFSSTSYSENVGLVALTRVASRHVVLLASGLLVVLGLASKFAALVATVPGPIVGGLYITLFGLIAAIGLATAARADLHSQRNQMILGFCLFFGLSLPAYFAGVPALGYEPVDLDWPRVPWLADMVETVGSTGMAVAAIFGLLLDNLIPGSDEERGLAGRGRRARAAG